MRLGHGERLRTLLRGDRCLHPASVFDPLSARAAAELGYEVAFLAGSVASLAVLGAPDLNLITLTELAGLARRICRAAPLPLLVDADDGYGNALNAARTVEELIAAGVAGLTLEDTLLPRPFSEGGGERLMISVEEGALKLAAAIEARADRDLVIVARTSACMLEGVEAACIRAAAYAAVGVDGIFVAGARTRDELLAVSQAAGGLPLLAYNVGGEIAPDADLVSAGVRLLVLGHDPFSAAVSAGYAALASQRSQQPGSETPAQLVAWLSEADRYAERSESYLTKRREP